MEMHQLRYFLAVAEERNFTRGAEKCFVSQPSLSAQILKLEDELGEKLFNRLGRTVELTPSGRLFEKRARLILMEVDNARKEIQEGQEEPRGTLRVGVTPTVGPYLLPPVLKLCRQRYPELKIQVEENLRRALLSRLTDGEIEVMISPHPGEAPHIEAEPLLVEPLFLAMPRGHPLADKAEITIQDFKDEPLITLGESSALGEKVFRFFGRNDFQPNVGALCAQVHTAKALVDCGQGLAILPEMAREGASPYDLVFKSLASAQMTRLVFALTHEQRYLSAGGRAFLEASREIIDQRG